MSSCPICGEPMRAAALRCRPHWFDLPMKRRRMVWDEPDPRRKLTIWCEPFLDVLVLDYYDRHPA